MDPICDDLTAEHEALDALVAGLPDDEHGWSRPTPADGWAVRDQISHLWFFDQRALLALTDPDAFMADAQVLLARGGTDASVVPGRSMSGAALLEAWRRDRVALVEQARGVDASVRVPWYGPAMGARSFVTARLMETWAHGLDVADAIGAPIVATDRLRHVAHIGVRARPFSYAIRRMELPDIDVHVSLTMPDDTTMTWGDPTSEHRVRGPVLDFCLVVTQRRHLDDTALDVDGVAAIEWMGIAQAFAGAPGTGRPPLRLRGR